MDIQEIIAYIEDLSDKSLDGEINAIKALGELRLMSRALEGSTKKVDALALEAAEKYPGKTFILDGIEWTKQDGARKFKTEHIQAIVDLEESLKYEKELAKKAAERAERPDAKIIDGKVVMPDGSMVLPATIEFTKSFLKAKLL